MYAYMCIHFSIFILKSCAGADYRALIIRTVDWETAVSALSLSLSLPLSLALSLSHAHTHTHTHTHTNTHTYTHA